MFSKIFKILNDCKFYFKNPKANELVVLDNESIEYLENILKNRNYFILITRLTNLKKIYLTPKIIFFFFLLLQRQYFFSLFISTNKDYKSTSYYYLY